MIKRTLSLVLLALIFPAYSISEISQGPADVADVCCDIPGDADNSGSVTIGDVTYVIARIFSGGSAPVCCEEGDADGSGGINIGDVTYLIAYIFSSGPEPVCGGCPGFITWSNTYGGSAIDYAYSVALTGDGGYILAGFTESFGAGGRDGYAIKTDSLGDTVWTQTTGGTDWDELFSVSPCDDGGSILAGYTESFGPGGAAMYLVKSNAAGDTLWTGTYGGLGDDYAYSAISTTDGGFVLAGYTTSFGAVGHDMYMVKTDSIGDTEWTRMYGGLGNDRASSIAQTSDGGYILAGATTSFGVGGEVYLVKTDASGDTLWTRTYGGSANDYARSVTQTVDGGYILGAESRSFGGTDEDVYLIKTDSQGDTLWTRTFGGAGNDGATSVALASGGGYVICGFTVLAAKQHAYLIRIDASGDSLWTRVFDGIAGDGAVGNAALMTGDGGYIIGGNAKSTDPSHNWEMYLIKTDDHGHLN